MESSFLRTAALRGIDGGLFLRENLPIDTPLPKPDSIASASSRDCSLFEDLVALTVGGTPFEISFEDLTGFTYDVPEFALSSVRHRLHCSEFCEFAKRHRADRGASKRCTANKRACNRKATKGRGFVGMCHLGLMERVEPLLIEGKVMGVFYFGSVVIAGREREAENKIVDHCRRGGISPDPYFEHLRSMPKVTEAEWEAGLERFQRTVRLATAFAENIGIPVESYTVYGIRREAFESHSLRPLTRGATAYVRKHYTEPCQLVMVAKALGCHPVHLSRTFRGDMKIGFNEFVHRVRVTYAKRLLRVSKMNVTQVSYETGFADPAHFNRVFQRIVGMTPGDFVRSSEA